MFIYLIRFIFAISAMILTIPNLMATESGDWLIRSRLVNINPNDATNNMTTNDSIMVDSEVSINDGYALDVDITYMFAKNWGVELFLDSSSKHTLYAKGHQFLSLVRSRIAETRILPAAFVLQYHLVPDATIRPYAGLGAHYALFFDEKESSSLDRSLQGVSKFKFDDSLGFVAQVGADYCIDNDWFFNVDLKYMNIDTSTNFTSGKLGKVVVDMDIDPWIIGFGMGRRF